MKTLRDRLTDACQQLHFKVTEVDDLIIEIRFQMHDVHICYNKKSPDDCIVLVPVVKNVPDSERQQVLERCNSLNERLKHSKYYITGSGVVATIEFLFENDEELKYQLEHAVRLVSQAKTTYEQYE